MKQQVVRAFKSYFFFLSPKNNEKADRFNKEFSSMQVYRGASMPYFKINAPSFSKNGKLLNSVDYHL